jgi:hypothetical protein
MKKLGKLSISPEKIMRNEDLINLKGGYDGGPGGQCPGECAFQLEGYVYCDVCYSFIQDQPSGSFDSWCCSSCDESRFSWSHVCG